MSKILIFFISILIFITSCSKSKPELTTHSFDKIGWIIQVPKTWAGTGVKEIEATREKGRKALQELGNDIYYEPDVLEHLLNVKLDKSNFFQSLTAPHDPEIQGGIKPHLVQAQKDMDNRLSGVNIELKIFETLKSRKYKRESCEKKSAPLVEFISSTF